MFWLPDWIKMGAAAIAAALFAGAAAYEVGHWRGDSQGYDRRVAEVAAADARAELERKHDDAKLQGMSDYDLCVAGLGGSGMPVDACEQLLGVSGEQP